MIMDKTFELFLVNGIVYVISHRMYQGGVNGNHCKTRRQ